MKAPPALFDCFGLRKNNNKSSRNTRKMPCTNCMAEYTRRRKEIGCAKCGFGFCERCVGQKCAVPAVSSAKPVPVCNACYCLLTDPKQQQKGHQSRQWAEKSRDLPPIGQPLQQNAWGSDQMPPPSLRSLYNGTQMGRNGGGTSGGGGQRKAADDWGELEARLARLNDPNQFEEPNGSQPVVKGQQQNIGTAKAMPSNTARLPVAPPIEELEERLAALRGVPVEVVRKPRLMVMNDSDEEQDTDDGPPLSDEAAQLLRQVELGYAANSSSNRSSKSVAGGGGKDQTVAHDQRSLDSECPSSVLQNAISDALRAPSPSNLSSSGTASSGQLYPNLAECVRQTREDAQAAEREAMEFIRRHQQPN
uniref:FYVE-type domain-containing protein n=1 Tax=Globodera rostochiensis TaxID=31243 RepID=A0A914H3C7_GLORO